MKNLLLIPVFLLFCLNIFGQSSHIVTAFDFGFAPENLVILPGDTVIIENQGYHSMTEVTESDWNSNTGNSNGGFWVGFGAPSGENWFVLNETGLYFYICVPHAAMGMKGTVEVADPTVGIAPSVDGAAFSIAPQGSGRFLLRHPQSEEFVVITTGGKRQVSVQLNNSEGEEFIDLQSLAEGVYLGVFLRDGEPVRVVKFMR